MSAWGLAAALVLAGLVGGGCATQERLPAPERFEESAPVVVVGDWDDVEAAVSAGASQAEMAVVVLTRPTETSIDFELVTITDEPATLKVRLDPESAAKGKASIALEARVGRFGDRAWEERLIGRVGRRLGELHGVDVAPIRVR